MKVDVGFRDVWSGNGEVDDVFFGVGGGGTLGPGYCFETGDVSEGFVDGGVGEGGRGGWIPSGVVCVFAMAATWMGIKVRDSED